MLLDQIDMVAIRKERSTLMRAKGQEISMKAAVVEAVKVAWIRMHLDLPGNRHSLREATSNDLPAEAGSHVRRRSGRIQMSALLERERGIHSRGTST